MRDDNLIVVKGSNPVLKPEQSTHIMANIDEQVLANFSLDLRLGVGAGELPWVVQEDVAVMVELDHDVQHLQGPEPVGQGQGEAASVDQVELGRPVLVAQRQDLLAKVG